MVKRILILVMGLLLIGSNIYAAGDLVVNGLLGVGKTPVGNAKLDISATTETFGLALLSERDTTGPVAGASFYIFLDGTSGVYAQEAGGFSNSTVYRRQTDSDANSLLYAAHNQAFIGIPGGSGYTVDNMTGLLLAHGMHSGYNSTATLINGYGILSTGLIKDGAGALTVTNFKHIYLQDRGVQRGTSSLSVTNQTGLWIDKQQLGSTVNYGIVLNGDGAGADIVFGAAQEASIYASAGELFAKDGLGNVTQISPHDPETGEWVFYSKNIKTGRVVRINMEKLVKAVEKLSGDKFMIESVMSAE